MVSSAPSDAACGWVRVRACRVLRDFAEKKQKQDFDTSGDNFINPHEFKVFFARALRNVSNADFEKSMKDLIGGKLA